MASWAGFSDEDLKQLQQNNSKLPLGKNVQLDHRKANLKNKARPQRAVPPMKKETAGKPAETPSALPMQALLSQNSPTLTSTSTPSENKQSVKPTVATQPEPMKTGADAEGEVESPRSERVSASPQANLLTDDDGMSRELTNLEQYQRQQKMMEELNRKKKQMLAEALAQRQKQATVEAHKLNAIKKELSHLDQMLTADVNVIRDKIEDATREYTEANKRYEQAEKEFIMAKINLHKKSDLKEQLTEHLYTIIHQNEIRKAKKLAELMEKLNLATEEDNSATSLPELPVYSLLGNMQTFSSGNLTKHSPTADTIPDTSQTPADTSQTPADNSQTVTNTSLTPETMSATITNGVEKSLAEPNDIPTVESPSLTSDNSKAETNESQTTEHTDIKE